MPPKAIHLVSNFVAGFSIISDLILSLFPLTFILKRRRPRIEKLAHFKPDICRTYRLHSLGRESSVCAEVVRESEWHVSGLQYRTLQARK